MMLKYIGRAWLPGVPARDMTEEEAEQYDIDRLLQSGLYIRSDQSEGEDGEVEALDEMHDETYDEELNEELDKELDGGEPSEE